jgi:hypothetical protein
VRETDLNRTKFLSVGLHQIWQFLEKLFPLPCHKCFKIAKFSQWQGFEALFAFLRAVSFLVTIWLCILFYLKKSCFITWACRGSPSLEIFYYFFFIINGLGYTPWQ